MKRLISLLSGVTAGIMLIAALCVSTHVVPVHAADIIAEWNLAKIPGPPEIKPVTIDPKTTALLLLDFNKQTCNTERRPRCIATIPAMKEFLGKARKDDVAVVYSITIGAVPADIAPELSPREGEPVVVSGPDKFIGTELEKILAFRKVKTVIVTGTAAHGAVLYTASGAALRGLKVIVPVDVLSAEDLYAEQYTVWHLLNAPRVSTNVTITRTGLIR